MACLEAAALLLGGNEWRGWTGDNFANNSSNLGIHKLLGLRPPGDHEPKQADRPTEFADNDGEQDVCELEMSTRNINKIKSFIAEQEAK